MPHATIVVRYRRRGDSSLTAIEIRPNHGATDDYGYYAIQDKVSIHDLHATILHLMGMDHKRLTFHHSGRDYRLTDVFGKVVQEILS